MTLVYHHSGHGCGVCRQQNAKRCDGSGTDERCGTTTRHRHCVCGLAMDADAELCDLCVLEGLEPTDYDEADWDGVSYPSFRRNRTTAPHPSLYVVMFSVAYGNTTPAMRASMFR